MPQTPPRKRSSATSSTPAAEAQPDDSNEEINQVALETESQNVKGPTDLNETLEFIAQLAPGAFAIINQELGRYRAQELVQIKQCSVSSALLVQSRDSNDSTPQKTSIDNTPVKAASNVAVGNRNSGKQAALDALVKLNNDIEVGRLVYESEEKFVYRCGFKRHKFSAIPLVVTGQSFKRNENTIVELLETESPYFTTTFMSFVSPPLYSLRVTERLYSCVELISTQSIAELSTISVAYLIDGLLALKELKRLGIVHCDISPSNYMYSGVEQRWKLIDFEYAEFVDGTDNTARKQVKVGSKEYRAPEITKQQQPPYEFSFITDMFSFGETATNQIVDECEFACAISGDGGIDKFGGELMHLTHTMGSDIPGTRPSIHKALEKAEKLAADAFVLFGGQEDASWLTPHMSMIMKGIKKVTINV